MSCSRAEPCPDPLYTHTHTHSCGPWCLMRDDKQVCVNISLVLHFPAVCLGLSTPLCHYCLAASLCPVLFVILLKEWPSVSLMQYQCSADTLQASPSPSKKTPCFSGTEVYFAFHIPKRDFTKHIKQLDQHGAFSSCQLYKFNIQFTVMLERHRSAAD